MCKLSSPSNHPSQRNHSLTFTERNEDPQRFLASQSLPFQSLFPPITILLRPPITTLKHILSSPSTHLYSTMPGIGSNTLHPQSSKKEAAERPSRIYTPYGMPHAACLTITFTYTHTSIYSHIYSMGALSTQHSASHTHSPSTVTLSYVETYISALPRESYPSPTSHGDID